MQAWGHQDCIITAQTPKFALVTELRLSDSCHFVGLGRGKWHTFRGSAQRIQTLMTMLLEPRVSGLSNWRTVGFS